MIIFKKIILFLVIFALLYLIFPLNLLYSQSSTGSAVVTNQAAKPTLSATTSGALAKEERRKKLNLIVDRLNAAIKRIERISQRITSRLVKIKNASAGKETVISRKVESQNQKLIDQIDLLKTNITKLEFTVLTLADSNTPKKDYQVFKKQASDMLRDLKGVQKGQKELISDLKQLVTTSVSPTLTTVPSL